MRYINERIDFSRFFYFFVLKIGYFFFVVVFYILYICVYLVFCIVFGFKNINYNFKLLIGYRFIV